MYYKSQIEGVVRIPPELFGQELEGSVLAQLKNEYEGRITEVLGRIIAILNVDEIKEGTIIPGDGGAYHKTKFTAIHFIPENNELIEGEIREIAKFGAFIDFGAFEGMVHLSQTMDDYVQITKQNTLHGKESKKSLKISDLVRARIVAISFKDVGNPKIGLTMRQPYLGKLEWIDEEVKKSKKAEAKAAKK
jgi:DNA-directed RNA polymerase subunit E'